MNEEGSKDYNPTPTLIKNDFLLQVPVIFICAICRDLSCHDKYLGVGIETVECFHTFRTEQETIEANLDGNTSVFLNGGTSVYPQVLTSTKSSIGKWCHSVRKSLTEDDNELVNNVGKKS